MLIATVFKQPVMWSSAGLADFGSRSIKPTFSYYLLILPDSQSRIFPSFASLCEALTKSLFLFLSLHLYFSSSILFMLSPQYHRAIPRVKIFNISSLLMARPRSCSPPRESSKGLLSKKKNRRRKIQRTFNLAKIKI